MGNTFTIEKLIEAGYKEYPDSIHPQNRHFQKTVRDFFNKKMYFINVEKWNWEDIDYSLQSNSNYQFSSEVHFFLQNEIHFIVKFNIISVKNTIAEMEGFYFDVYNKMNCVPDIHNND